MDRRNRGITVYVRNKQRYDPSSKLYDFLHVTVRNYAQTTIGAIKEEAIRQTGNSARINDLFLNNEPLADDRSVAHYNIEDGTILETTSNPFWATCIYIKKCEADRELAANPNDPHVLAWTKKSVPRKLTLLSVLFNSKNEFRAQPPHFPTLDDFVLYLDHLNKKGATMHPHYTQKDLRAMHNDYLQNDVGRSGDPLGNFIRRYAIQLGFRRPDDYENMMNQNRGRATVQSGGRAVQSRNKAQQVRGQRQNARGQRNYNCEDCEVALAELYCRDCQNATDGHGLYLCRPCSDNLHSGAARRHQVDGLENAPKTSAPYMYVPHAFKAPFSILVAMYRALRERPAKLSMTEEEIKERAQPLTDTDLQDKQNGQYCAGFDCMEKLLMMRGFVQREDARNPTYALTDLGEELAERLFTFQQAVQRFMMSNHLPQIPQSNSNDNHGGSRICLIVDEQERDKERLLSIARERSINVQVRQLGAGDYIWIMTPPQSSQNFRCMGRNNVEEIVLPYIVERKSWEDLRESVRTKRFYKQINNMLGSGIENCFYLLEGSMGRMRYKPSEEQQKKLKEILETIFVENGFYVNYTGSWYKSVIWLLWLTALLNEMLHKGQLSSDNGIPYSEFRSRTIGQSRNPSLHRTDFRPGNSHVWEAEHYIDGLFRDSINEISLLSEVKSGMKTTDKNKKHVLIIEGLEAYNKRRQSVLNKCLNIADKNMETVPIPDTVKEHLSPQLHNMLHYDIMSYWQLRLQVILSVYVVRTEKKEDTVHVQERVRDVPPNDPGSSPYNIFNGRGRRLDSANQSASSLRASSSPGTKRNKSSGTKGIRGIIENDRQDVEEELIVATDSQTEEFMIQQAIALSKQEAIHDRNCTLQSRKGRGKQLPSATITAPPMGERVVGSQVNTAVSPAYDETDGDDALQRALQLSLAEAKQKQVHVQQSENISDLSKWGMNLIRQSRIQKLDLMNRNKPRKEKADMSSKNSTKIATSDSFCIANTHAVGSSLCQQESMEDSQDLNYQGHECVDALNCSGSRDEDLRMAIERSLEENAGVNKSRLNIAGAERSNKSMEGKLSHNSLNKSAECHSVSEESNTNEMNCLKVGKDNSAKRTPSRQSTTKLFIEKETVSSSDSDYGSYTTSSVITTNPCHNAHTKVSLLSSSSSSSQCSDSLYVKSPVVPCSSKPKSQSVLHTSDSQDEELQYALKLSLQEQDSQDSDKCENITDRDVSVIIEDQEHPTSSFVHSDTDRKKSYEEPVESIEILDSQSQDYDESIIPLDVDRTGEDAGIDTGNSGKFSSSEHSEVITIDSQDSQDFEDTSEEFSTGDTNKNPKGISVSESASDIESCAPSEKDRMDNQVSTTAIKKTASALDRLYMEHLFCADSQPDTDNDYGNILVQDSQGPVVNDNSCEEQDATSQQQSESRECLKGATAGIISVEESVPDCVLHNSAPSVSSEATIAVLESGMNSVEKMSEPCETEESMSETNYVANKCAEKISTDIVANKCPEKSSADSVANMCAKTTSAFNLENSCAVKTYDESILNKCTGNTSVDSVANKCDEKTSAIGVENECAEKNNAEGDAENNARQESFSNDTENKNSVEVLSCEAVDLSRTSVDSETNVGTFSDTDSQVDCIPPSPEGNVSNDVCKAGGLASLARKSDNCGTLNSKDRSTTLGNGNFSTLDKCENLGKSGANDNYGNSGIFDNFVKAITPEKPDNFDHSGALNNYGSSGIFHDCDNFGQANLKSPHTENASLEKEFSKRIEEDSSQGQEGGASRGLPFISDNKSDSTNSEFVGKQDQSTNDGVNAQNEIEFENSQVELINSCDQKSDNRILCQSKEGRSSESDTLSTAEFVVAEDNEQSGNGLDSMIQLDDSESLVTFGNEDDAHSPLPSPPRPARESTDSLPSIEDSQDFSPTTNVGDKSMSFEDSEDLPAIDWVKSRKRKSDLSEDYSINGNKVTSDLLTMGNSSISSSSLHGSVVCHSRAEVRSEKGFSTSRLSFMKSQKEMNKTASSALSVSREDGKQQNCTETNPINQIEISDEEVARQLQRQLDMEYENEKKKKRLAASSNRGTMSTRSKRNVCNSGSDDVVLISESEMTKGCNSTRKSGKTLNATPLDHVIVCDDVVHAVGRSHCSRGSVEQEIMVTSMNSRYNLAATETDRNGGKRTQPVNVESHAPQGQSAGGQGYDEDLDRAIALSLRDVKQSPDGRDRLNTIQQRYGRKRPGSGCNDDPPVKIPCSVSSPTATPSHYGKTVPSHSATSNMPASASGIVGTPWYKKVFAADSSNKAKLESQKQLQRVRDEQNVKYQSQKSTPRSSLFESKHTAVSWQDPSDDVVQLDSEGYLIYDRAGSNRTSHKSHDLYSSSIAETRYTPVRNVPKCSSSLTEQNYTSKEWKFSSSTGIHSSGKEWSSSSAIGQNSSCKDWSFNKKESVLANESEEGKSTLTQSESLSKTKCGNCKMIGHKRTWEKCPYYFSLEEVKRRQEQADKLKERAEAKERADEEVKDNLEQHHKRLANIAAAITAEQERVEGTIQKMDKRKKVREKQRSKRGRR